MRIHTYALLTGASLLLLSGCAQIGTNRTVVAWSQACNEVASKRTTVEHMAEAGKFTALQKAEIKGVNDQLVKLCTTPPTPANQAKVTAQITALLTKLAVYAGINQGVKQ